ncbi:ORF6N domain-containing protein [Pedobacter sp. ISL-68]|nr:ORF6N domain-containing protein [Pedobacter sp. ISL-64]MBT2588912.1 ORF6N domain-containing protein [Pedobacter sp. ISL-68]
MLDSDLAELYGVETKVLNQSIRRNMERFPGDFMFQLTVEEWEFLRSQIVTSKNAKFRIHYYCRFRFMELDK